jgi:hypothetical protein
VAEPSRRPVCTVVSSFPDVGDTYPQVAEVARALRGRFDVRWVLISERGLFFDRLIEETLLAGDVGLSLRTGAALGREWLACRAATRDADVVIAIDFMAFVFAASATRRPVALWSLDYISDDEPRYGRRVNRLLLAAVRRGLRRHPNVIIQDEARLLSFARAMRRAPGSLHSWYLPVALPALATAQAAPNWAGRPRLMQIGGVNISRCHSDFLVERFLASGGGFDLSFHGRVYDEMRALLDSASGRIEVSPAMVAPDELPAIVSRCSIGFIGNRQSHEQFRLLRRACGQLVEFLRCGKPVISMGPNDLGPHLEAEGVGFQVADAAQFDAALARIHADYAAYSRRALRLFETSYDLAAYAPGLCDYLAETALTRPLKPRRAGDRGRPDARDFATVERPA